jgi:YbgC/YbaW family acyl-CoA thioester hydrolase
MYPFLKLTATLVTAKFRSKLNIEEKSILKLRAGFTDIDMFMELNNARYFTYMELGRWDFSYRVGFVSLMKKNKWGIVIGGASVRYRRRIPFLSKFTLTTQLICHDGRWFYFLQEMHRKNKICFSALMKAGVTSKNGLVPASEVIKNMGVENWNPDIPKWVGAWIEAEGQRPWPTE